MVLLPHIQYGGNDRKSTVDRHHAKPRSHTAAHVRDQDALPLYRGDLPAMLGPRIAPKRLPPAAWDGMQDFNVSAGRWVGEALACHQPCSGPVLIVATPDLAYCQAGCRTMTSTATGPTTSPPPVPRASAFGRGPWRWCRWGRAGGWSVWVVVHRAS